MNIEALAKQFYETIDPEKHEFLVRSDKTWNQLDEFHKKWYIEVTSIFLEILDTED